VIPQLHTEMADNLWAAPRFADRIGED
jgi:hypothetical protein